MAKQAADQTLEPDAPDASVVVEDAPDPAEVKAAAAAVKTSDDFDKRLDAEGVTGDEDDDDDDSKTDGDDDKPADKKDADKSDDSKAEGDDDDSAKDKEDDDEEADKGDGDKGTESAVSDESRQKARDLGLTDEEINQFADDADLERTTTILSAVIADDEQESDDKAGKAQAPAKGSEAPVKGDDEKPGFELKFKDEKDIDPEILANIKAMHEHYQGETKALREQVDRLLGNLQEQDNRRFLGRFDERIKKLGDEFVGTFGKGKTGDLSRRSPGLKNREAVRRRMYGFAKGLNDAGETIPAEEELFGMAVNSLFGKQVEAVKGLRTKVKTGARSKQRLGRAAAQKTGKPTPDQKAIATSRKFDELIDTSED